MDPVVEEFFGWWKETGASIASRAIVRILGEGADACDAMQNTLLNMIQRIQKGEPIENLGGYIRTAARHEALRIAREQGRQVSLNEEILGGAEEEEEAPSTTVSWVDVIAVFCETLKEDPTLFQELLKQYQDADMLLWYLKEVLGWSYKRMIDFTGLPRATIESRIKRFVEEHLTHIVCEWSRDSVTVALQQILQATMLRSGDELDDFREQIIALLLSPQGAELLRFLQQGGRGRGLPKLGAIRNTPGLAFWLRRYIHPPEERPSWDTLSEELSLPAAYIEELADTAFLMVIRVFLRFLELQSESSGS